MCTVSVIIPFYNGNRFLTGLHECLEKCSKRFDEKVEVIVVNDSPDIEVETEKLFSEQYILRVVKHSKNEGIHKARITGLTCAKGQYILFLDQDDIVEDDFMIEMVRALNINKNAAFAFSNGMFDDSKGNQKLILNSYGKVVGAKNYKTYLRVGNLLASPGQCLVRKNMIPSEWKTNIMKTNCSDDLLLWILILKKQEGIYVNRLLYRHINTGENASGNRLNGYASDLEICEILKKEKVLTKKDYFWFELRCKGNYNKEKGENYNRLGWYCTRGIEIIYRITMRLVGSILFIVGKKLLTK